MVHHCYSCILESFVLDFRRDLAQRRKGTCVTHDTVGHRSHTANTRSYRPVSCQFYPSAPEAYISLWIRSPASVFLDPLGSVQFCSAPDFSANDNSFCVLIRLKRLQRLHNVGPGDNVASDTDTQALSEASSRERANCLVAQCARLGSQTDVAGGIAWKRLESDTTLPYRSDDSWGVCPNET